jgi:hypothetical protein
MLGVYDFCAHYEWTFEWFRLRGGEALVRDYWKTAISEYSQTHAAELILGKGFEGMKEYWGHTLQEEAAGYHTTANDDVFRIDMAECPSKGFLTLNHLKQYHDYCDHCMGWIGPLLKRGDFVVDSEHNHCGQCWFEIRKKSNKDPASTPGTLAGDKDIRLHKDWKRPGEIIHRYVRTTDPEDKTTVK